MIKNILSLLLTLSTLTLAIEIGEIPPKVNLVDVKGKAWSSSSLRNKISFVFYIDPDKKSLNRPLFNYLKKQKYSVKKVQSIAIINLKATWIPNVVLKKMLKDKQKEFKTTLYVEDKNKLLVKKWKLSDDNSDFLLFDKNGKLLYKKFGKASNVEIEKISKIIDGEL